MRFELSESLLLKLKARLLDEPVFRREPADALCIYGSFNSVAYLTLDGRVLVETWDHGPFLMHEASDDEAVSYLVAGAKTSEFPELLDLLPVKPAGGQDCAQCLGRRWARFVPEDVDVEDPDIVCDLCSGRGWIPAPT